LFEIQRCMGVVEIENPFIIGAELVSHLNKWREIFI
jgi:hypothetical protein